MGTDFLLKLDETNSISTNKTGGYILTIPKFEIDDSLEINSVFHISSTCKTVIKCTKLSITSVKESLFENINFECAVRVEDCEGICFSNCTFEKAYSELGALTFVNTKSAKVNNIVITNVEDIPGLYLSTKSSVEANDILIHDLPESLLVCNSESNIILRQSHLHHTKANGIYSSGNSYLQIENCIISDTEYPSIYFSGSSGKIINNTISNILQNGLSLNSSGNVDVIGNQITKVSGSAISFLDGSKGTAVGNNVKQIEGNGVYVNGGSEVEITDNDISENDYPGIAVLMKSNAILSNNRVSKITYSGICVRGATDVQIKDTFVYDIKECGISISDTEKCLVSNCTIENCDIAACEAYNGSKVIFTNNKVTNMKQYALQVYTSAEMTAEKNEIKNIGKSMVNLLYKGGGQFINNKLFDCPSQKVGHTTSNFFCCGNGNFKGLTNISEKKSANVILDKSSVDVNTMCIKCNKKPRNCFLFDCGHMVYCSQCAKQAFENKENCPICRFPIVKVTEGFDSSSDDTCILCLENKQDSIITPCGHMGFCGGCLDKWFKNNKICPICRREPAAFKKIIEITD